MLENTEKMCWKDCNEKNGPCKWCGEIGMCCKRGLKKNGCDGNIGGHTLHVCADPRYNSGTEGTRLPYVFVQNQVLVWTF